MKKIFTIFSTILCLLLPGCRLQKLQNYENRVPKIKMQEFFNGKVEGWGIIFDWKGMMTRSFTITMIGSWDENNAGPLSEDFIFDDGSTLHRLWQAQFFPDGSYVATASDIVGQAKGQENGCAVQTNYVITLPYNDSSINISMDDWCYQIDEKTIINKAIMKKFGIKVGELIICLKK